MIIRILGLDPSLSHTAYAVAEVDTETFQIIRVLEMDTIVTAPSKEKKVRKSSDQVFRARSIAKKLRSVITDHNIKLGTSEIPSGAQSASAAHAFGVVIGLVASLTIPVLEVSPREVKLATAGTATADKEDIMKWAVNVPLADGVAWGASKRANDWEIQVEGGYVLKTMEHQADAIAAIKAAISSEQFRQLAGMMNALI